MNAPRKRPSPAGPLALEGDIQTYAWGDPRFLPELLGLAGATGPYAELWLGDHPALPARVLADGGSQPMNAFVQQHAEALLSGDPGGQRGWPFLLKILAAAKPLSIQVHPNRDQARAGFVAEQARPEGSRSYVDDNHKPELLVALTPVVALSGFRTPAGIADGLAQVPELARHLPPYEGDEASLRGLLTSYFSLPDSELLQAHTALIERLEETSKVQDLGEDDPRYWALHAHRELGSADRVDRGLLFVFLLNLVRLSKGEALYMAAGVPHAYLRGAGVELMATSDNVLRCGLTSKRIDPQELLRILDLRSVRAPVMQPSSAGRECVYRTPAAEFELRSIAFRAGEGHTFVTSSPELLLFVAAPASRLSVSGPGGQLSLSPGQCCLLIPGEEYCVSAVDEGTLYRANVPAATAPAFRGAVPKALAFGTSGLRGLIADITDMEAYINTRGFLDFVRAMGEVEDGDAIPIAGDLRPSTDSAERSILRAVAKAVADAGFSPDYLGRIPTPALTCYGLQLQRPSIMVTGSHIPFDRNGIKFNRSGGEVLKQDEEGILTCVARRRAEVYAQDPSESPFDDGGMLRAGQRPPLPPVNPNGAETYRQRYLAAFPAGCLSGLRVVVYEHSAVGRELLADLLRALGAEVHPMGRASGFVAIDTEALARSTLPALQAMVDDAASRYGAVDAIVSTDGDSDRPLVLGVDGQGQVRFVSGDLLGLLVADYLDADAVAVPVSATDAIERHLARRGVTVTRTRIGSPYVIAAMATLRGKRIVGWEANGGFLIGSPIGGLAAPLPALPTRDAVLPICAVLHRARSTGASIAQLVDGLPPRHTAAGLLDEVPAATSQALLGLLGSRQGQVENVEFDASGPRLRDAAGRALTDEASEAVFAQARQLLERECASGDIARLNLTDGVRVYFACGEIIHLRPSGNAPQLRIYAVADSEARAQAIVAEGLREPDGLLRRLLAAAEQEAFVAAVTRNIRLTSQLFASGQPAGVIGTVSGSSQAQAFWQGVLDRTQESFRARKAVSFHEDLPVNQAFGILLLWQRLRPELRNGEGALVAFVFGEGSRATPFTETDNGQKPAILSYVQREPSQPGGYLSMVELALRYFAPVESYLRRSGFDGMVVKWGDEVQVPTRDLSGSDARFAHADVVRFVSMRAMTESDACNKDWVGVSNDSTVTAFIPRRPLSEMRALSARGLLVERDGKLWGGVNLGSIAVSRRLLDALHAEFEIEVNDPGADRKARPDLDPQLFTVLTIATLPKAERKAAFDEACRESPAMAKLAVVMPDVLARLSRVVDSLAQNGGAPVRIMALDFEDQYWGDIGQHRQMYDFYMALCADSPEGRIARALSGVPEACDSRGNRLLGACTIDERAHVRGSVLIDAHVAGESHIVDSVLIGSRLRATHMEQAFDVDGVHSGSSLHPRAGTYRVLSEVPIHLAAGERLTTLFLPEGPAGYRVHEDTDLRDRAANYERPILGNARSFAHAHASMAAAGPTEVQARREALRKALLEEP